MLVRAAPSLEQEHTDFADKNDTPSKRARRRLDGAPLG